jgi:hypothetical protein
VLYLCGRRCNKLALTVYVIIKPYLGARVAPIEEESGVEVFSLLETMEMVSSRAASHLTINGAFL